MKTEFFTKTAALIVALLALLGLSACSKTAATPEADPNVDYYTCTMHPSVRSQDPHGKCPICSMDLVPVMKKTNAGTDDKMSGGMGDKMDGTTNKTKNEGSSPTQEFSVPVERQQQIGVTYTEAKWQPLHHTIRSVGFIVPDRLRRWEFVARVEGYVQNLGVTSPGEPVARDQPLLTIYSPELLTASREFVNLLDMRDRAGSPDMRASTQRLIDSAKLRLAQWNVTDRQIAELEKSRRPSEFLTLYSPFNGVVEDVPVDQGRKVMTGDRLVSVADLTVVWVWAQFYENELAMLKNQLPVTVTSASYPGRKFEGKIGLVNPFVNEAMRTGKVRIDIPNTDLALRPGMYVNIDLSMDMDEGLTIPVSAVMPTGTRSLVFVDLGSGKLEPRFVQLGAKYGDFYQVQDGLKDGERVVSSANFLIDAESKVQGAVKSFEEPAGGGAMPAKDAMQPMSNATTDHFGSLVGDYLALQKALAKDDLAAVAPAAVQLQSRVETIVKSDPPEPDRTDLYRERIKALNSAIDRFLTGSLDDARVQFGKVSAALIALASDFPPQSKGPIYVMHCPMWKKSPAQWIQATEDIENPFMGVKMSGCGNVVKKLEAAK